MRARDLMSRPVTTVTPADSVRQAAILLSGNGFTALPVTAEDDVLVGIVTEADVVRDRFPRDPRYHRPGEPGHDGTDYHCAGGKTVGEVMTADVLTAGANADVVDVVATMLATGVRSMPVLDGRRVVGVITRRDLVRALARDDELIAVDVRHRLRSYGGPGRWQVAVRDGEVVIGDEFGDATDRHVATVLAEAVPGVTGVRTVGPDHLNGGT